MSYIADVILWTLALYGFYELTKSIIFYLFFHKKKNTYLIIIEKNGNDSDDIKRKIRLVDWEELKNIIGLKV